MTHPNSTISPLRQRMIDDMALRKLNPRTQQAYIRSAIKLAQFLGHSPHTATAEDLRRFQLHLASNGVSSQTINVTITGLRFFFEVTLEDHQILRKMSSVHEPRKLPVILSPDEVKRLLEATTTLKYKTALSTAYGTGLRASEITHLKVTDIDSQRMQIHVEQGKGSKDRNAMLSPALLALLQQWWHYAQAKRKMLKGGWLFPGMNPVNPMSTRQLNRVFHAAATLAGINKAVVYQILFQTAAWTLCTIASDPRHLGANIGFTLVLHTWGSALTHHPHVHAIVLGGGLSVDGQQWIACKPGFFLPVRVLSRLFRRLFLEALGKAHQAGELRFFGDHSGLADPRAFGDWLKPLRKQEWYLYAKRPFAGPDAVLAYLSRYTHRVAIANSRLLALDEQGVTFKWKDYRETGRTRHKTMTLDTDEFIRRFLIHILPKGFHRIRHYGWMANTTRVQSLAQARELLEVEPITAPGDELKEPPTPTSPWICPTCAAPMIIIQVLARDHAPRGPPAGHIA